MVKIHLFDNGVTMVGKAWEIQAKLKEYSKDYKTVQEWINQKAENHDRSKAYK